MLEQRSQALDPVAVVAIHRAGDVAHLGMVALTADNTLHAALSGPARHRRLDGALAHAVELVAVGDPQAPSVGRDVHRVDKSRQVDQLTDQVERIKASIRAKVEHPFRVIKRQFGQVKARYRGLKKNTAQLNTLFALSNLWMARRSLLAAQG